jgi:vancomycin permeability regulator SanA
MIITKRFSKILVCILILLFIPIWLNLLTTGNSQNYISASSKNSTGLVFGASIISNSYPSLVLKRRLDKAIELFESKKIISIIVSGAKLSDYSEPDVMKNYLINNGIMSNFIKVDERGFDTLRTCQNAKNNFSVDTVTIITQHFHTPRAVALCQFAGLKTITAPIYSNQRVNIWGSFREFFATNWNIIRIFRDNL